jgi:hypothetical protein
MNITPMTLALLIASTFIATGCSSEEEEQQKTQPENTSSKASALTSSVESAANNPSGTVDISTIAGVFDAQADMDLATLGGLGVGAFDIDPLQGADLECVAGGALNGNVDMSCATDGEVTGSISYDIAIEGAVAYVYYSFDQLCIPADDLCMTGEGAVEAGADANGSRSIVAGNLTITQAGDVDELRYGVSVFAGAQGVSEEVVLWHNGATYVVTTQIGSGGLSYSVTGANGTWSCDISGAENAWSGSCANGVDNIDF